jgi:nitroimidazol reductase NimA-like FMN-containing flavoprotein (pyridoxamine 5'-phosphate oxidase superfamily)
MPREHADIKMTPEELRAFLLEDRRCVVATLDPDGGPWADAAGYTFADERVWFRLPADTRSVRNLRNDPRVCVVVESKPAVSSYYDIRGAMVHGSVDLVAGDDLPAQVRDALAGIPDPVEPDRPGDTVVFSVGIESTVSFVFAKIKYRYQDRSLDSIQEGVGLKA